MRASRARSLVLLAGITLAVAACGASGAGSGDSAASSAATSRNATGGPAGERSASEGGPLSSSAGATTMAPSGADQPARTIGATVAPAVADIVENGKLAVRVRSAAALHESYATISGLAVRDGGFVSSSTLTASRTPTASLTVRVPNDDVEALLRQIGAMGRVTVQTLSGQDVTGQVIDLSVEITNLTSEEAAVRQLLSHSGSVADILTVQQQLFQLQDEVQELTAQSNSLHNRVQYATVAVTLTTRAPAPAPRPRPPHRPSTLTRFWHLTTTHSVGLVRGVVLAAGWSAPGLVLLLAAGGVLLVLRRRRRVPGPVGVGPASPTGRTD